MIDRGFNTAETLGTFGAKLEIPSFTKGQSQLWPKEVEDTRTIEKKIREKSIQYSMRLFQLIFWWQKMTKM